MEEHRARFAEGEPELSVVIPTHNRSNILRTTLQHLAASTLRCRWEAVVVANACTDDTVAVVTEVAAAGRVPVRLIEEARPSAAIARNRGARAASGGLLVFLDDDILLQPDGLSTIWAWHRTDGRSLLVGQVVPLPEHLATPFGGFRQRALGEVPPDAAPSEVDWFASGLAGVPATVLGDLGGYAENYPAAGLEDADFAIRARRAGHRIVFNPAVVGVHNDWAGTTARDYCRRAAVHCSTAPLLAQRFPDNDHPWGQLVVANRPPSAADGLPTRASKRLKLMAVGMAADRWLPLLADRLAVPPRLQDLLYRAAVSLAMFGGYQRGLLQLEQLEPERPSPQDGSAAHQLSIVMVTFNCGDEVERAIESLERHPPALSHEILVVDNASSDDTVARLRARFPQVRVLALEENIGYGSASNLGAQETEGEYLLLLNPDTETTAGAVDRLLELARTTAHVGVVGPRLLLRGGVPQPSGRRLPSPWRQWFEVLRLHLLLPTATRGRLLAGTYSKQDELGRVDWVSGACHLVPRSVWDKLGGLTERTFCGFDDLDFCWRAKDAGFDTWFCPDAEILHHCGVSVARRWTPREVDTLAIHNIYVILEDHWSRSRVKLYCAGEVVGTISDLLLGSRRAALTGAPAATYRSATRERLHLLTQLLLERIRPIARHEPGRLALDHQDQASGGTVMPSATEPLTP